MEEDLVPAELQARVERGHPVSAPSCDDGTMAERLSVMAIEAQGFPTY
jgi:hypothetical protein